MDKEPAGPGSIQTQYRPNKYPNTTKNYKPIANWLIERGGEFYSTKTRIEHRPAGVRTPPRRKSIRDTSQRTAATRFFWFNAKMFGPLSASLKTLQGAPFQFISQKYLAVSSTGSGCLDRLNESELQGRRDVHDMRAGKNPRTTFCKRCICGTVLTALSVRNWDMTTR